MRDTNKSVGMFTQIKDNVLTRLIPQGVVNQVAVQMLAKMKEPFSKLIKPSAKNQAQQDLKRFKTAKQAALNPERPNRTLLYDVLDAILEDNHLHSLIETRTLRVSQKPFRLVDEKTGKENLDKTKLFDRPWFQKFISLALYSIFIEPVVIEFFEVDENGELKDIKKIPERHVRPDIGHIVKNQTDEEGWDYLNPPYNSYYMQIGQSENLGLLVKAAPMIIFKRYVLAAWNEYSDRFIVPFRTIFTPSTDAKRLADLGVIAQEAGSAGWAVLRIEEKMELLQADTDAHETFNEQLKMLNGEVSKLILGTDATADLGDTGTAGARQVLKEISDIRYYYDATFVKNLVNYQLIPKLKETFGYQLEGYRFEWDESEDLDVDTLTNAVVNLSNAGFEVDPKYITDRTGIPILGLKNKDDDPDPTNKGKDPLGKRTR